VTPLRSDQDYVEWEPTPEDERVKAHRLSSTGWEEDVEVSSLRKGDVFKMVFDGEAIHPITREADDQVVALAVADAFRMDPYGSTGQTRGYGVLIEVFDYLDQIKTSLS
jgi:hypothetical protein